MNRRVALVNLLGATGRTRPVIFDPTNHWSSTTSGTRAGAKPPNLALQRTPATGRAFSTLAARWSVAGSAELWR